MNNYSSIPRKIKRLQTSKHVYKPANTFTNQLTRLKNQQRRLQTSKHVNKSANTFTNQQTRLQTS